ncbi:MAG: conjugal transfer protein TraD [Acetobacteraceae bacterium]
MRRNRLDRARARADTRHWVQDRRARTRHLIELGGLVHKAGLVELVDDDRATLLGAFLELAVRLQGQEEEPQGESPADLMARWRRRGLRAFDADKNHAAAMSARNEDNQPEAETG